FTRRALTLATPRHITQSVLTAPTRRFVPARRTGIRNGNGTSLIPSPGRSGAISSSLAWTSDVFTQLNTVRAGTACSLGAEALTSTVGGRCRMGTWTLYLPRILFHSRRVWTTCRFSAGHLEGDAPFDLDLRAAMGH